MAPAPFILESGMGSFYANVIDMSNRGVELSLGSDIVKTKDFSFTSILNFSLNRSKIDKLNGAQVASYFTDAFTEGQPLGVLKGYEVLGIAQSEEMEQPRTQRFTHRIDARIPIQRRQDAVVEQSCYALTHMIRINHTPLPVM